MMPTLYLDNAATTAVHQDVIDEIATVMKDVYGNPSSLHSIGEVAHQLLWDCRKKVGNFINCEADEIIFTSGACEANSLAIKGYLDSHNTMLITTPIEHKSILLCKSDGYDIKYAPIDSEGFVDLKELERLCSVASLRQHQFLVSIQAANGEIGTIQNLKSISNIVHRYNGIFHTDATQLLPYEQIDVKELGIDMMSVSGQKLHAPKGIGFLYVKRGIKLKPLIYGTQMEQRRGGTENIPYIAGLTKALSLINYNEVGWCNIRLCEKWSYFITKLFESTDFELNGPSVTLNRIPGHVSISFKGINGDELVTLLDAKEICVSTSSACNNLIRESSSVLKAISVDPEYINGTIRLILPPEITYDQIDFIIKCIARSIKELRSFASNKNERIESNESNN